MPRSMAYSMPYASQGFCDPTTMARTQIPHEQESVSSRFSFDTTGAFWESPQDPTKPFDLQHMANIDLSIPGLHGLSLPYATGTGFQLAVFTPPPIPPVQSSSYQTPPSIFFPPVESLLLSQPNTHTAYYMAAASTVAITPNPVPSTTSSSRFWETGRIVPVCHRDHAKERSAATLQSGRRTLSRASKRHSPYPCANHSAATPPASEPTPRSRKRPSPSSQSTPPPPSKQKQKQKRPRTCTPLPDTLQPIKIPRGSRSLPRCPMPKCGAEIEACDAAWRGHFKALHHDDLCLAPGCDGLSPSPAGGECKARCPCPLGDVKACGRGGMAIESVGRHLLNVHFKVAYACPVCGMEREWRESACTRHIRLCLRKQKDGNLKKGSGH